MSDPIGPARISLATLPGLIFQRHAASSHPVDGTIALVGGEGWQRVGTFRDGAWLTSRGKPFKWPVLFWIVMENGNG